MVSLKVNIQKKDLWLLSAIVVFLVGVGFVIAIGSGDYQIQGHDLGEIQKCEDNQTLKMVGGNWACAIAGQESREECEVLHAYNATESELSNIKESITIPDYCKNGKACLLVFKNIYSFSLTSPYTYTDSMVYYQWADNFWTSPGLNTHLINGDSTQTLMLASYGSVVRLYDDYSGVETDANHWAYLDSNAAYTGELIACRL